MADAERFWNPTTFQWEAAQVSEGAQKVVVNDNLVKRAYPVVPSDTEDLAQGPTIGLYIGGLGNITVVLSGGTEVTFASLCIGVVHPISVKRVKASGTTAVGIVAVY